MNRPLQHAAALALGLTLVWPQAALAIAARHDRPEARYVQHGADLPAVGSLVGLFTGTLIAPDWVLTAAHGAELMTAMVPDPQKREFEVNGKRYHVEAVFVPDARVPLDWSKGSADLSRRNAHDIALVRLSGPVSGVAPLRIHSAAVQPGAEVTVAGAGTWSADGRTGVPVADAMRLPKGKVRAGTNRIDGADTSRHVLSATFDDPASEATTDLECGLGAGDSGGPLLVATHDGWAVAGVISAYDVSGKEAMGVYGDRIEATRVGAYADWIRQTMESHATPAATNQPASKGTNDAKGEKPAADVAWPRTAAGTRARAYFEALNAADDEPMRTFIPIHWSPASLEEKSLDDRLAQQRAPRAQFGAFTPVEVRDEGEYAVTVLADASGAPFRLAFTFELSPEAPHYSIKTRIAPAQ